MPPPRPCPAALPRSLLLLAILPLVLLLFATAPPLALLLLAASAPPLVLLVGSAFPLVPLVLLLTLPQPPSTSSSSLSPPRISPPRTRWPPRRDLTVRSHFHDPPQSLRGSHAPTPPG